MSPTEDTTLRLQIASSMSSSVLLVDDDPVVRTRTRLLLTAAAYDVHEAASAEAALQLLATVPCQIVITDWDMAGMGGLALCRALRLRDSDGYIYVLLLTRHADKGSILLGLEAGADDYIVKGAPAEEILARVEVARRITRLEQSLRAAGAENGRLSFLDPLTSAYNRRFLTKYLPRELERARRYSHPLALLGCDIDEFKRINDAFGHQTGDEVLQAFVQRSLSALRQAIDWLVRSGGEEFVVVLPETPLKAAHCVAEKLRRAFGNQPIPTSSGPLCVTVSIGVTALETLDELAGTSVTKLLKAADDCLYVSKLLGRDRTTCVPPARAAAALSRAVARSENEVN